MHRAWHSAAFGVAALLSLTSPENLAASPAAARAGQGSAEKQIDPAAAARAAAAAGDFRVFTTEGLAFKRALGLTCSTPDRMQRLARLGGTIASDTSEPVTTEAAPTASYMVTYNRTLGASLAFQKATSCRNLTACELRFQEPDEAVAAGVAVPGARRGSLDRACLTDASQLIAVAAAGRTADLRTMLARPAATWRSKDHAGRDSYDRALIAAASNAHPDAIAALLPATRNAASISATAERARDAALLAVLQASPRSPNGDVRRSVELLTGPGARLEFDHAGQRVSVLSVALSYVPPGKARDGLVEMLLARGADPNGPACPATPHGDGVVERGDPPLLSTLSDEGLFDRLVAAGANPAGRACAGDGTRGSLTSKAIERLAVHGGGTDEERRVAVKLLKQGGRVDGYMPAPPINNLNVPAASIVVAAFELVGRRDAILEEYRAAASVPRSAVSADVRAALDHWSACPHSAPKLERDTAELCRA